MADNKGVMIICEIADGKLASISTELLGAGRQLADNLGQELVAVVLGSGIAACAQEAVGFGANKVYVVDDPLLKTYQADAYMEALDNVFKQAPPRIILLGQNAVGRDLAPRLAFRMNTAATLDCIELSIDPGTKMLLQTKPVYGGNARAIYTTDQFPQIATLRAKTGTPLAFDGGRKGDVVNVAAGVSEAAIKAKVTGIVKEQVTGIKVEDAKVIVAGGRGIGNADGFKQLEELAKILKGAVGASRPPCDNKWVLDSIQIGLTGKIVSPELYFAVAISGSSQHMAGCAGAKTIVAINKDPEANIFKEARFGVVGDWKKVVPALTAKVKELVG